MSRRGRTARVASRQRIETLGNGTSAPTNKTIQTAETGELYFIDHNHASALTITLPPMQDGAYFKFIFKTALTEDGSVVIATSEATAGSIVGSIFEQVTGGSNAASGVDTDDGTDVKITLSDDIYPGSSVECFCDGSVWHAHARLNVSGVGESGFGDYVAPNPAMTRLYLGLHKSGLGFGDVADFGLGPSTIRDNINNTLYDAHTATGLQVNNMAYGKDGSGNPIIVFVTKASSQSLFRITPAELASQTAATRISFNGGSQIQQRVVAYGNGVWISAGDLSNMEKNIFRSTDGGTTWNPLSLQTVLAGVGIGEGTGKKIYALTTDGAGKWWFGIDANGATPGVLHSYIFCSTDDGQTWSLHHTLTTSDIYRLTYTNNSLVATYNYAPGDGTGGRQAVSAAASDTTDWGTPVFLSPNGIRDLDNMIDFSHGPRTEDDGNLQRIASGGGRVIAIDKTQIILLEVNGKNLSVATNGFIGGDTGNFTASYSVANLSGVATDGEGNWYISGPANSDSGAIIAKNTNNADPSSWANLTDPINEHGLKNIRSIMVDRYLPL